VRLLVTGSDGFIAKNLILQAQSNPEHEIISINRETSATSFNSSLENCDAVVHLAGVNRPKNDQQFVTGNSEFTESMVEKLFTISRKIPVVFSSSTQAAKNNPYGQSKRRAEIALERLSEKHGNPVHCLRIPNVFGKWCRPNYNSVVATFCHNTVNNKPIEISDENLSLDLVYVDDLVKLIFEILKNPDKNWTNNDIKPLYTLTLGELAGKIRKFKTLENTANVEAVGSGVTRALYATYLSYKNPDQFSYNLPTHGDDRGVFAEFIRASDYGQFSFFTAEPGVTRGGHYHNTKSERFLVVSGNATFRFMSMFDNSEYSLDVSSKNPIVVETIPGWAHDITNTGNTEMVVMLWANEVFDQENPDTYAQELT